MPYNYTKIVLYVSRVAGIRKGGGRQTYLKNSRVPFLPHVRSLLDTFSRSFVSVNAPNELDWHNQIYIYAGLTKTLQKFVIVRRNSFLSLKNKTRHVQLLTQKSAARTNDSRRDADLILEIWVQKATSHPKERRSRVTDLAPNM
ncbi:hypothetical protein AVEN_126963-1 [Araneus ventricosus]|uniref:Uncharacterized protein n=1 Tax=Araneus ventricosus TaxID=182803 RepID=A0A4Y2EDW7_ARAVE|nr:hypothetical protein AVEN_126963-1 [Araneus ventricosus]